MRSEVVRLFEIRWGWIESMTWRLHWEDQAKMHFECVEIAGPDQVPS